MQFLALGNTNISIDSCFFSSSVSANQYYITVNYDLEHNAPSLYLSKSINQALPTSTQVPIAWTHSTVIGTALSWSGGVGLSQSVQIKEPGDYIVNATFAIDANVLGVRQAWIRKGTTDIGDQRIGHVNVPVSGSVDRTRLSLSALVQDCVAGDIVQIVAHQTSGASLNITTTTDSTRLAVYRYKNNKIPTGSISGILIGIS